MAVRAAAFTLVVIVSAAGPIAAQTDAEAAFALENTTELSLVATGGNASSSTLGLKSALVGTVSANTFKVEIGGIRAESEFKMRRAVGTADDFVVSSTDRTELTAESYFAKARYERALGTAYAFSAVGWDRNTFAGVLNRYALAAGAGKTWVESDNGQLKTDLAATYTIQKDVDPSPGFDDSFAGIRLSLDAKRQLTESTEYTSVLIIDENVERSEDLRANWLHSVSVTISEGLALKTSLQLLFDNDPSLIAVPLESTPGNPTGEKVLTPGEELDRILTVALVITL